MITRTRGHEPGLRRVFARRIKFLRSPSRTGMGASLPAVPLPSPDFMRIEIREGVVGVWHERSARDAGEAQAVLDAIDAALAESGIELLMFDSREADRTPPEVQEIIWSWLVAHVGIRKVATLMHSRDLAKKVRVTAVGSGLLLKTFDDETQARYWLHER